MFTAKITNKTLVDGVLTVFVEFSNGVTSLTEWCKPQDEDGLIYWVKSRLAQLNAAPTLDAKYAVDQVIDTAEVAAPEPTAAEIERDEWLADYRKWVRVKTTLIDTGVLTGNETQVLALKTKVQTNFKAAYLAFI
jgi:hypothetical protein